MAPPRKTVAQYEAEATRVGECLVHPTVQPARKVFQLRHGNLPSHIAVCHTCDNPKCIEDAHHFTGTWADNVRDAVAKGRHSCFRKGGARNTKPHDEATKKVIGEFSRKMWERPGHRDNRRKKLAAYWTPERRAARSTMLAEKRILKNGGAK